MAGPSRTGDAVPAPQWRHFTFFDVEAVKDAEDLAQSPRALRDLTPPFVITATSPGSPLNPAVIVSSANSISILDRHFVPERTFTAWEGQGRTTALIEAAGILLAVGDEDGTRQPVLKIWDLTREDKRSPAGGPLLMRNVRIQQASGRPHPVSRAACALHLPP